MGLIYQNKGETEIALKIYESVVTSKVQKFFEFGIILNNMGSLYSIKGETTKAIESFERALEIIKNTKGENCEEAIKSLIGMGATYLEKREAVKALELYQKVLQINETTKSKRYLVAIALNNIGSIYKDN